MHGAACSSSHHGLSPDGRDLLPAPRQQTDVQHHPRPSSPASTDAFAAHLDAAARPRTAAHPPVAVREVVTQQTGLVIAIAFVVVLAGGSLGSAAAGWARGADRASEAPGRVVVSARAQPCVQDDAVAGEHEAERVGACMQAQVIRTQVLELPGVEDAMVRLTRDAGGDGAPGAVRHVYVEVLAAGHVPVDGAQVRSAAARMLGAGALQGPIDVHITR